eukprot:5999673-Pleurochrysis_carterae.AAC.1
MESTPTAACPVNTIAPIRVSECNAASAAEPKHLEPLLSTRSSDVQRRTTDPTQPEAVTAAPAHRFSMCTIVSILLNVAALGAAAAMGTRQLWND